MKRMFPQFAQFPHPGEEKIIIAKHRHGPIATVELNFEPDLTRFSCRERRYDSNSSSIFLLRKPVSKPRGWGTQANVLAGQLGTWYCGACKPASSLRTGGT
jgi:hypothetical protein